MSYKILHEDEHLFHMQHKDGSVFAVAKKAIGKQMTSKIQKLYDGGEVEDEPAESDVQANTPVATEDMAGLGNILASAEPQAPSDDLAGIGNMLSPTQASEPTQEAWHAPMLPGQPVTQGAPGGAQGQMASPQPSKDPYGVPGMQDIANALKAQAGAKSGYARDADKAFGEFQIKAQAQAEAQAQKRGELDQEQAQLQQKLMDGKIDPNRTFKNMSTGGKIRAAISLILGGIGSGLTHQPNAALALMNKAVDDDIEAQKADLGKTHTLLSLNMNKYRNLDDAQAATRLQMNTVLQMQLQSAAAKATSVEAQAGLGVQLAQLKMQGEVMKQTLATKLAHAASLGVGTGEGGIPEGQEPAQLLLDPKYQANRVLIDGRAYQATDPQSANKVKDVETLAEPVVTAVRKLQDLAKDPMTRVAGSESNNLAHALMGDVAVKLPLLSGATIGAKRVNSEEIAHQVQRFQDPTRMDQILGSSKDTEFFKSLEGEVEVMRKNHLIGYKGMGAVKSFQPASGKLPLN